MRGIVLGFFIGVLGVPSGLYDGYFHVTLHRNSECEIRSNWDKYSLWRVGCNFALWQITPTKEYRAKVKKEFEECVVKHGGDKRFNTSTGTYDPCWTVGL